jgi:hypothetical protein
MVGKAPVIIDADVGMADVARVSLAKTFDYDISCSPENSPHTGRCRSRAGGAAAPMASHDQRSLPWDPEDQYALPRGQWSVVLVAQRC